MQIAPQTLRCRSAIPSISCVSTRDVGWTSLLLDHHSGIRSADPCVSVPTPDVRIGVATRGRYWSERLSGGQWRRANYSQGSLCIHRRGESTPYRFPISEASAFGTALIYLPCRRFLEAGDHLRRIGGSCLEPSLEASADSDPAIYAMTTALIAAMMHGADDLYAETAAAWLAVHLLTRHGPRPHGEDTRQAGRITDARLNRVVGYMTAHFAEPLSLERLAAEACVSKFHFTRLFRLKVGRTPHRFLRDIRLETALEMLAISDLPVSEIGIACGFPNQAHFSAAFASKFGVAPRAYRASLRR